MNFVSLDGRIVAEDRALIPATDPAVLWGWGLFETLRVYSGVPFSLDRHLARMKRSMPAMKVRARLSAAGIARQIERLCECNRLPDAACRLTLTAGGHLLITLRPLDPVPDPLRLITAPWRRSPDVPIYGHKTLNYLENMLARRLAKARGALDAVLVDPAGRVLEASACNVYAVFGGTIHTPALRKGILPGVTRALALRLARRLRIPVRERDLRRDELFRADEVFISNSLIEIQHVSALDGRRLGADLEVSRRLAEAYRRMVAAALRSSPTFSGRRAVQSR